MSVYKKSTMQVYSDGGQWEYPCEVRISEGSIALSYTEDGQHTVYEGQEVEPGHFKLQAAGKGGSTLHRFSDGEVLDGWWSEGGSQGMWRVELDDE